MAPPNTSSSELAGQVQALRRLIADMEAQRDRETRRRRRQLLMVGVVLSLVAHLGLMIFLAAMHRPARGGGGPEPVTYEFAILQDQQLTELQSREFQQLEIDALPELDELTAADEPAEFAVEATAPQLDASLAGAMPTLGGSGSGEGDVGGLAGGSAGTSFFGISSRGTRFAYIFDISASMGQDGKFLTAVDELVRSIRALPDYAHFHVVFYNSQLAVPPMQRGWIRARPSDVAAFDRWLRESLGPAGGTDPRPAFQEVFALKERPDAIFFLTDGAIATMNAEFVAELNRRGQRVAINAIAFGDPGSQDLLRRIASESGGAYRFVPSR